MVESVRNLLSARIVPPPIVRLSDTELVKLLEKKSTTLFKRTLSFHLDARLSGRCSNNDQNASNSAAAPSLANDVLSTSNPLSGLFQRPRARLLP